MSEALLLGFLLLAGLGLGAVLALALGRLLDDPWLRPLHRALSLLALALLGAAALLPLVPLPRGPALAWAMLAAWGAAGWFAATHGNRRGAGAALAVALFTGALAMAEWALRRDPDWSASLGGVALVAGQAGAALGLAVLASLRGTLPEPEARTGLERLLLSLALAAIWLGFTQFLVAWAADLPAEAAWYRRRDGGWLWLMPGLGMGALLLAVALGAVPQWRLWRLRAVALLLVLHHAAQLPWLVRPEAARPASPADLLLLLLLLPGIWWWRATRRPLARLPG